MRAPIASFLILSVFTRDAAAASLSEKVKAMFDPPIVVTTGNYVDKSENEESSVRIYRQQKSARVSTLDSPAVILIHGGGWSGGAKEYLDPYAQILAKAGFVVLSINYRLADPRTGANQWPAQLQDVQMAVRWAKAKAGDLRLDPERICAFGDSAGGHLAMHLGYRKETFPGDRSKTYPSYSSSVNCVVNLCGPANLEHPDFIAKALTLPVMGGKTPEKDPKFWKSMSPIHLIERDSAPTLVIQNSGDTVVPASLGKELADKLKEKDVPHDYLTPNGDHILIGTSWKTQQEIHQKMVDFIKRYNSSGSAPRERPTAKTSR